MNMLKQLNAAITYIEQNLCARLDLDEAARLACVTADSFIRFFSYMTGMTLNEYVRRRRLTLAARDLQHGADRIIDIAVKYGYNSADAFAKAFAKQHGITPAAYRKNRLLVICNNAFETLIDLICHWHLPCTTFRLNVLDDILHIPFALQLSYLSLVQRYFIICLISTLP